MGIDNDACDDVDDIRDVVSRSTGGGDGDVKTGEKLSMGDLLLLSIV